MYGGAAGGRDMNGLVPRMTVVEEPSHDAFNVEAKRSR